MAVVFYLSSTKSYRNNPTVLQLLSTYVMEYYAALKKEPSTDTATTWLDLKGVMLRENSQSQETPCCMVPFR